MRYAVDSTINPGERELDEFWRDWCLNRLKDRLKEEIEREYAEKGYVDFANLDPRDGTFWLRVALAL
jgi:hypothetical protein